MPKKNPSPPVELDEALAAEYTYIVQTATQANEDRARIASFYLIAVGSLLATILGTQFIDPQTFTKTLKLLFSGLFVLLTLMGTSTIAQLARLRAAWYEAMLAMNQIKDFMMSQNRELKKAFRWTTATLPPKFKTDSISYSQAREAAVISGITFGAAMYFALFALLPVSPILWSVSALSAVLAAILQLSVYKRILN